MALLPFDDRDGEIWLDGVFVPWRSANIHVLTHSLHYGGAVFEGARAYDGRIFKLEEHTARLFYSAEALGYALPYSEAEINQACQDALVQSGLSDAYLRPFAWRGSETMGVSAQDATIHVAIAVWAWPAYFSLEQRMKGLRLALSKWRRPAPETAPVHAKASGLYMICTLSKHAAESQGFDDALMLDHRGLVAEATGANVFFVRGREIVTPVPDCFLDGITRRSVIALAQEQGLTVVERHVEWSELGEFEEAFLTGTAAEVSPISEIGPYKFTVGEVSLGLLKAYDVLVRTDPACAA